PWTGDVRGVGCGPAPPGATIGAAGRGRPRPPRGRALRGGWRSGPRRRGPAGPGGRAG
ncbi:DUF11 domain-containing protein, partial [Kineosporiaceae bacterium B12]|nr:DUF11 domain-containing protein [Kineococcus rubinsiae]